MKTSSSLVSELRALFGMLRFLAVAGAIIFALFAVVPNDQTKGLVVSGIPLKFPATKTPLKPDGVGPPAEIRSLKGEISLQPTTSREKVLHRLLLFVPGVLGAALTYAVFEILFRLCRNVERGDVFTTSNVTLLRRFGIVLVVYSFVSFLSTVGIYCWFYGQVDPTSTFEGFSIERPDVILQFMPLGFSVDGVPFGGGKLVGGLLLLVLAKIFQEGLKLKQDAELTV